MLGSGNFCNVYKGVYKRTGEAHDVAIKICHNGRRGDNVVEDRKNAQKAMTSEAEVMSYYVHNHIIQFYGLACDHPPILIVMEYCPGGSLDKLLKKEKENISMAERIIYSLEAARGMRYLHSKHCIHRDLAARNCLISSNGYIKIADFGLSKIVGNEDDVDIENGGANTQIPLRWMAPESLKKPMRFCSKTDVWAYSILLYEIFNNGIKPWADDTNWPPKQIAGHIRKCLMPDLPQKMPKDIIDLVKTIWVLDADSRPTMNVICNKLMEIRRKYPAPSSDKLVINKIDGVHRTQTTLDTIDAEDESCATQDSKLKRFLIRQFQQTFRQKTDSHDNTEMTQKTSIEK
ncbi:unnamed protein product [Auanema sp. JU1783]|nr:unnamed protein product [Auanema sp. JU1783]